MLHQCPCFQCIFRVTVKKDAYNTLWVKTDKHIWSVKYCACPSFYGLYLYRSIKAVHTQTPLSLLIMIKITHRTQTTLIVIKKQACSTTNRTLSPRSVLDGADVMDYQISQSIQTGRSKMMQVDKSRERDRKKTVWRKYGWSVCWKEPSMWCEKCKNFRKVKANKPALSPLRERAGMVCHHNTMQMIWCTACLCTSLTPIGVFGDVDIYFCWELTALRIYVLTIAYLFVKNTL